MKKKFKYKGKVELKTIINEFIRSHTDIQIFPDDKNPDIFYVISNEQFKLKIPLDKI